MLLQTKLFVPVTHRTLVPRPQLLARLDDGLRRRLTLVAAPAGFGKTTLLANWGGKLVEEGTWRFAWLSLDGSDDDLPLFFSYFMAALQTADPHLGDTSLRLLQSPQAGDIRAIVTLLLNHLSTSRQAIVLALDDYHLITNPTIHEAILFLVENAPPHFHLVLSSRADPPFSLARLRARHQLAEIRQDDLRFSRAEAAAFLNQLMALDLSEAAVSALEQRTEGWAAGLQMAALSLQNRTDVDRFIADFTASNRYLFDYLTEEALARRPPGTRAFLLQASVLDRFCAALCDAVLEREGSQAILEKLESANLFVVPLDDDRHWYRYHHLFGGLLQQYLRREQPERIVELHARASRWFEQAGYTEEAIKHALAADDAARAAALVTASSAVWLRRGEISKMLSWVERLPEPWRYHHPQLILNQAWARFFRGSAAEVESILAHMPAEIAGRLPYSAFLLVLRSTMSIRDRNGARAIAQVAEAESQLATLEPSPANLVMRGAVTLNRANAEQLEGNIAHALLLFEQSVGINREAGNLSAVMNAYHGWGWLLVELGKLLEAEAVFQQGLHAERAWAELSGTPGKKLLAAAPVHMCLGQLFYEWNRLDEAEVALVDAVELLTLSGPINRSEGLAALARLRLTQERIDELPLLVEQLERAAATASGRYARVRAAIALARTRAALFRQRPTPALQAGLEQSLAELGDDPATGLARARLLLALARPESSLPLLQQEAVRAEAAGRLGGWLAVTVLLCLAHRQSGDDPAALDWLGRSLPVAQAGGHVRLFLDGGPPIVQLLETAVEQGAGGEYASFLLAAAGSTAAATPEPPPTPSAPSTLSPREIEVLRLVAQGLTNKEIASRLVIATSTAKRHTVNIYNKLGANNRAEATARAYELDLVD